MNMLPAEPYKYYAVKCEVCKKPVDMTASYETDTHYTVIFRCHNDKRRVDVAKSSFETYEEAKEYIEKCYPYIFNEEAEWTDLGAPETDYAIKQVHEGIKKWLTLR